MADGSLIFDTKVDTDGFDKGTNTLKGSLNSLKNTLKSVGASINDAFSGKSSKVIELENKISETESGIEGLKSELEQLSATPFESNIAIGLQKDVEKAEQQMFNLLNQKEALEERLRFQITDGLPPVSEQAIQSTIESSSEWQKLTDKIAQAEQKVVGYENALNKARMADSSGDTAQTTAYQNKQNKLDQLVGRLNTYRAKLDEVKNKESQATKNTNKINSSLSRTSSSMKRASNSSGGLAKSIFSLGNMFKMLLLRMAMRQVIEGVKEGFQNLVQYSSSANASASMLMSSLTQLKNSLATAFLPILNVVAPILNTLIKYLSAAANAVAQFFSVLTGSKGTYTKAVEVQQDYAASLSSSGSAASDAADDAKKAANTVKKSLAPFDELNQLTSNTNTDTSTGIGEGTSGGGVSPTDMFAEVEIDPKITAFVEKLKALLDPTVQALGRLKQALEPFKTFVATGAMDFYNHFLVPVGKWVFGVGLPRFIDAISNGLATINWQRINDALVNLWDALAPFAINIGEGLLWLWENVLVPLAAWTISNVLPLFLDGLANAISIINEVVEALKPLGQWLWDEFLQPIASRTGGLIVDILEGIVEGLGWISDWISNNQELVQTIAIVIGSFAAAWGLVNLAIGIWNGIGAIATGVTSAFGAAVAFLTSPIGIVVLAIGALIAIGVLLYKNWDVVSAWCKKTWGSIKDIFASFGTWIKNIFQTDWSKSFGFLGDCLNGFLRSIGNIWNSIKQIFNGIVTFVKGVFTGNWKQAWEGIVSIVKGIFNGIVSVVKAPINVVIGILNGFIGGLNKIKVPDWVPGVGGKGINISKIPYLATGTVVPANAGEFAAVLGDNKREPEIVSPLSTMKQALGEVIGELGGVGGGDIHITLEMDGDTMLKTIIKKNQLNTRRTGKNALA